MHRKGASQVHREATAWPRVGAKLARHGRS